MKKAIFNTVVNIPEGKEDEFRKRLSSEITNVIKALGCECKHVGRVDIYDKYDVHFNIQSNIRLSDLESASEFEEIDDFKEIDKHSDYIEKMLGAGVEFRLFMDNNSKIVYPVITGFYTIKDFSSEALAYSKKLIESRIPSLNQYFEEKLTLNMMPVLLKFSGVSEIVNVANLVKE